MKLKKFCLFVLSMAVGTGMLFSLSAEAATFDFRIVADQIGGPFDVTGGGTIAGGEGLWTGIVGGGVGLLASGSGISVIGSATNSAGGDADAYFDENSAGLGACSGFSGIACSPGDDDNVGARRVEQCRRRQLRNADPHVQHGGEPRPSGLRGRRARQFHRRRPGQRKHGVAGRQYPCLGLIGTVFSFQYIPELAGVVNEFYIESVTVSAVPLPGALPLFLTKLAGMGVMRWRWRRNEAA